MPRSSRLRAGAATAGAVLLTMAAAGVAAQEPSRSVSDAILAPVIVTAPPPVAASSELLIPGKDFELLPHGRPADVLRLVPGPRAVILDPRLPALPQVRGYELGVRSRVLPRVELSAPYWVLDLKSELVFAGDDGTTEARGPSHRQGWEVATKIRRLDWLTWGGNVTLTDSAFDSGQAIPLAPRVTARADLTARLPWGLSASAAMRYVANRYADESRQQTARGHTLFDLSARYRYKNLEAFLIVENLANAEWREAQFFFESRLPGEPASGVPDIHYTPGNPRTFLGGAAIRF